MPREGVPYPERALCSLRCAIQRIEQALGLKMNSVNGVGPDGQGDVKLISDSSALSVTDDPVQHEVHLDLDTSLLPAAAVTSVNGQTGVVVLDGSDIEGITPGETVNQEISALGGTITGTIGALSAEITNRQNADSTLQTNINAVTAAVPGEVSSQIASNATIAQLVYADQNENLKITDVNQYAVGLTGNQEIPGRKIFYQATGWFFGARTSALAAGSYFTIVNIPRNNLTGTRGHIAIWLKARARADSLILSIYHNGSEALDLEVVVPHQGTITKTWTLSQDDDNIYLSYNADAATGSDSWLAQEIFCIVSSISGINAASENASIPGTVLRSMTL